MALPVTLGSDRSKLIDQLIGFCLSLFRINLVLLDRGFASGEVINVLQQNKLDYLILAKRYATIRCMLDQLEAENKTIEYIEHEISYNRDKTINSVNTNLVLIKDVADYDWCFYISLRLADAIRYIITYKQGGE